MCPGGSSGGSAAAVALAEAVMATGSDTGGSIRQPAAFCGVVGLKPTYGLVSRYGLVAFASSLDQIGPLTKDVTDTAIMLNVLAGHDKKDSTSVDRPLPDYQKSLVNDVKNLRIGVIKELLGEGIDPKVKESIQQALKKFEELGAKIIEVSLLFDYAVATYLIAPAEASSNLGRYDGVKYGQRSSNAPDLCPCIIIRERKVLDQKLNDGSWSALMPLSAGYYDAFYLKSAKGLHFN